MCYYCHILKNNLNAPAHPGTRCLDCANKYSQIPMVQRKYDHGKLVSLLPSAPPPPLTSDKTKRPWYHRMASSLTIRRSQPSKKT